MYFILNNKYLENKLHFGVVIEMPFIHSNFFINLGVDYFVVDLQRNGNL